MYFVFIAENCKSGRRKQCDDTYVLCSHVAISCRTSMSVREVLSNPGVSTKTMRSWNSACPFRRHGVTILVDDLRLCPARCTPDPSKLSMNYVALALDFSENEKVKAHIRLSHSGKAKEAISSGFQYSTKPSSHFMVHTQ